ncbi:hypothetical protein LL962_16710 [Xanthomonas sp. NCPPB 1067]|uniref:hypothetical protein n=1 Tax=Xanthomonas sp. NCPPB 1067 TaxID=487524 RepID=UPI001E628FC4|nr:hypothetical protein [Xanthomonas sp. NCPPB 1067]MCC4588722.1 hypothetical protein [Xanthomonas sp. NCPPB 1067]
MPVWAQWVTFAAAVIGCAVAVSNLAINYVRGARSLRISIKIQPRQDEVSRLQIKVVNRGGVAVTIADISVVGRGRGKRKAYGLWVEYGDKFAGAVIEKGTARTFRIDPEALNEPLDVGANVVQVTTADERVYSCRFRELLDLKHELQCVVVENPNVPWQGRRVVRRDSPMSKPADATGSRCSDGMRQYGEQ